MNWNFKLRKKVVRGREREEGRSRDKSDKYV
jgi:hypothetical protein